MAALPHLAEGTSYSQSLQHSTRLNSQTLLSPLPRKKKTRQAHPPGNQDAQKRSPFGFPNWRPLAPEGGGREERAKQPSSTGIETRQRRGSWILVYIVDNTKLVVVVVVVLLLPGLLL